MRRVFAIGLVGLAVLSASVTKGEDWTRFRGPDGCGRAEEAKAPSYWGDEENLVWKTLLPGPGGSSPITLGDRIFLTTYTGYGLDEDSPGKQEGLQHNLVCLNRENGEILWAKGIRGRLPEQDFRGFIALHGYASSTPVTDGERVYAFFGRAGVVCYSIEGEPIWKALVGDGIHGWGSATSPILHKDLVIVNASVESQSIIALNRETGKEVWRVEEIARSWSTPLVVTVADGNQELVVNLENQVMGFDPDTGKKLWQCKGVQDYVCPSVIAEDDVVFISGGRRAAVTLAIRAGGRGDVTETHTLWELRKTPKVATPLYHDGLLYWIDQLGVATCVDAKTGESVYQERLQIDAAGDKIYASLVLVGDKLYGTTRLDGTLVMLPGKTFEEVTRNRFESDSSVFNGTPVPTTGDRLLIRSDKALYCVGSPSDVGE